MGRQGTEEAQITVSKQKAHWEGNLPFPCTALVYREIKSKLSCSTPIPLCRSDVNPRCCFSCTISLLSVIFSSQQISLLKESHVCFSFPFCPPGTAMEASASKQWFFPPYTFMRTSPKLLHSFHFQTAPIVSPLIILTFMALFPIFHVSYTPLQRDQQSLCYSLCNG